MLEGTAKFWAVRNAWAVATEARQAASPKSKGKGRFRKLTLAEQGRKWNANASRYLANRPSVLAASKGVKIQAPDMHRATLALLDALPAQLMEQMDSRLSATMFGAFNAWPVSSGYSKSALFLSFSPQGATFEASLGDAAPYALLIKGGPARRLIGAPAQTAAAEAIAAALQAVAHG
jgi:hypothetical protein